MTPQIPTSSAKFTCLCGSVTTPVGPLVETTHFPLPSELCHCDTCRRVIGGLAGIFVELKSVPPQDCLDACVKYASSELVERYFCRTCGTHTFFKGYSTDVPSMWFAGTGIIERSEDDATGTQVDTTRVAMHAFVDTTKDCGLVGRMVEVHGGGIKGTEAEAQAGEKGYGGCLAVVYKNRFSQKKLSSAEIDELVKTMRAESSKYATKTDTEKLLVSCHCNAVQFYILRPHRTRQVFSPSVETRFRQNNTKYVGQLCACRSCRLALGSSLQPWTYVPPENMTTLDGTPIDFGPDGTLQRLPGIKSYRNSEVATWSFCGTCGANMIYQRDNRREVVDVSAGVLRSDSGALAEDWIEWDWQAVSFKDECWDKDLLKSLTG